MPASLVTLCILTGLVLTVGWLIFTWPARKLAPGGGMKGLGVMGLVLAAAGMAGCGHVGPKDWTRFCTPNVPCPVPMSAMQTFKTPRGPWVRFDYDAYDAYTGPIYVAPGPLKVDFGRVYVLHPDDYAQLRKTVRTFDCPSFKRTDGDNSQSISESSGGRVETFCHLPVGHWCMPFSATNLVLLMSTDENARFTYRNLIGLGGDLVCDSDLGKGFGQGGG